MRLVHSTGNGTRRRDPNLQDAVQRNYSRRSQSEKALLDRPTYISYRSSSYVNSADKQSFSIGLFSYKASTSYLEPLFKLYNIHTLLDRNDCTKALLWSKTTLTTGSVGAHKIRPKKNCVCFSRVMIYSWGRSRSSPLKNRHNFSWVLFCVRPHYL